jgi:hypothetical protein
VANRAIRFEDGRGGETWARRLGWDDVVSCVCTSGDELVAVEAELKGGLGLAISPHCTDVPRKDIRSCQASLVRGAGRAWHSATELNNSQSSPGGADNGEKRGHLCWRTASSEAMRGEQSQLRLGR